MADAVRTQKVDVMMAVGPVNSRITADAFAASMRNGGTATFLEIDSADAIAANIPCMKPARIPPAPSAARRRSRRTRSRPSTSRTISSRAHSCPSSRSAPSRGSCSRSGSADDREVAQAAKIETPDTDKDAAIPAHPGAAAYVDGEEKTFLDRYSDYIWWGIMALSAVGSAGAWFAGYLKRDERMISSSLRDRLMDMLLRRATRQHRRKISTSCRRRPTTS